MSNKKLFESGKEKLENMGYSVDIHRNKLEIYCRYIKLKPKISIIKTNNNLVIDIPFFIDLEILDAVHQICAGFLEMR